MKIYISPSQQSKNITANGHSEQEHCNLIGKALYEILVKDGYQVMLAPLSNNSNWIRNAVQESNAYKSDLHICIHTNAGGGKGCEVLCHQSSMKNDFVQSVYTQLSTLTPTKDRGVKVRNDLYEINSTKAVCIYIEVDFHDNKEIDSWIDSHINEIAYAIANGIELADDNFTCEKDNTIYRVQVGAFKNYNNAESLKNELIKKGYDAFITKGV